MTELEMAKMIADICYEKLANNIVVLDLQKISVVCDYFVIADAPTRVQLNDIMRTIDDTLAEKGVQPKAIQGRKDSSWILLDYGSVVVHLFIDRDRDFYNLEGLWKDAPVVYSRENEDNIEEQSK